ncbi:glycoside hydrolase family 108 protein [Saccharicrinis aurantiacus]|uniref:glycoside hydrolase family 108 protein n=1 Tax=Saccharicrinis aurantiacus TaxID=1849719 RepID=UPI0009502A28|nr:glycosyl hydrolase 108 family protein [Saccharicrinis aurantiacus]
MFEQILKEILKHEGYYSNHSADAGGETYRGIARKFHPSWAGWYYIDEAKRSRGSLSRNYRIDNPQLEKLIVDFYRSKFWTKIHLDSVKDSSLQRIIFDAYVNSGGNGIKVLQRTLNESFGKKLGVDGAQGKMTVAAINSVNPQALFDAYKEARKRYYLAIASGKNAVFLKGWLNRLSSFNYTAVGLSIAGIAVIGVAGFFL